MNKRRRVKIKHLYEKLQSFYDELDDIKTEEEEAFDNMPEGIQGSSVGEESEECMQDIEAALEGIGNVIDCLEGVI